MLNRATISLILTNTIPLLGVLFFGWNAAMLLVLYWFENVVIGLYAIPKIALAKISSHNINPVQIRILGKRIESNSASIIPFFIAHFGIFTFVHAAFVFSLFANNLEFTRTLVLAGILMFVSHGISFLTNYIGNKEFERTDANQQMIAPYKRVVIMHITILLSAGIVLSSGQSTIGLLILVILKTALDLSGHLFEHIGGNSYKLNPLGEKIFRRLFLASQSSQNNHFANSTKISVSFPNNENISQQKLENMFKEFVDSGKFEEIAPHMSPQDVAKVKEYYQQQASSQKQTDSQEFADDNKKVT